MGEPTATWTWERDDFGSRWGERLICLKDSDREVARASGNAFGGVWLEIDEEDAQHIINALRWYDSFNGAVERGPWERTVGGDWVTARDGSNIAHVRGQSEERNKSNAALICAAPMLLEALTAICAELLEHKDTLSAEQIARYAGREAIALAKSASPVEG